MKKKLVAILAVCVLVMSLGILAACNNPATGTDGATAGLNISERDGLPNNLPSDTSVADHAALIILQGETGKECQTCHLAQDDKGTPARIEAGVMPEDHYVDGKYSSKQFDPQRILCGSCHGGPAPVAK